MRQNHLCIRLFLFCSYFIVLQLISFLTMRNQAKRSFLFLSKITFFYQEWLIAKLRMRNSCNICTMKLFVLGSYLVGYCFLYIENKIYNQFPLVFSFRNSHLYCKSQINKKQTNSFSPIQLKLRTKADRSYSLGYLWIQVAL